MRELFIIIMLLSPAILFAQDQPPVRWEVSATEKKKNIYTITVNAVIEPGWYIYAADDQSKGMEAIKTSFETKKICGGNLQSLLPPESIFDPVVLKNQKVYKGIISFIQEIELTEPLQSADIRIHAIASNESQIIALDTTITLLLHPSSKTSTVKLMKH
jgi:hypothetical protein